MDTRGLQAQGVDGNGTDLNLPLNEDTISLSRLRALSQPFGVVAASIELLDRAFYHAFDIGLQPVELVDILDAQAERLGQSMGVLYDQLPERYQQMLGTRDVEHAYRMELIELRQGDMSPYPQVSFSLYEWHELVAKHPDWADRVPEAICRTEAFYYPLRDLLPAKEQLLSRLPEGFLDRGQFQTEAIVSGFVSVEELGDRLLVENAPYVSVAQYGALSDAQRRKPEFAKLAYGAVLYDAKNVLKVPTAYLSDAMIRHTACCDFELLSQLPYGRLVNCPIREDMLCMAVREQVKSKEDVERVYRSIPACYRTEAVLRQLAHIARVYGVEVPKEQQREVQQRRERGR